MRAGGNSTGGRLPSRLPLYALECHGDVAVPNGAGTVDAALLLVHDPPNEHGPLVEKTSAELAMHLRLRDTPKASNGREIYKFALL